jgi:hypothetical protein
VRVEYCAPGVFGFGSSGGGELFAFEYRDARAGRILPLIHLDLSEAGVIADNFGEFAVSVSVPMTTQPQKSVGAIAEAGT